MIYLLIIHCSTCLFFIGIAIDRIMMKSKLNRMFDKYSNKDNQQLAWAAKLVQMEMKL